MDVILVGPGRAGLALSLRLLDSEHHIVGVLARTPDAASDAAERLGSVALDWDEPLPTADLLVIAVRDDSIADVADRLGRHAGSVEAVVHLSGLTSIESLQPFGDTMIGAFHPLQTLPTPEAGAARLEGSWVAITAREDLLADRLFSLAASLGMRGFELQDEAKPLYHAAAAAAANYSLAALAMSERLFDAAGVPFEAAGPLVRAIVDNAFELGPVRALTGPVARGDVGTVRAQIEAVRAVDEDLADAFVAFARVTAATAGTSGVMDEVLG